MSFLKASMVVTAASLMLAAPAFAQTSMKSDTTVPTGRSDSDSTAAMKSGGMTKSQMKSDSMTESGTKKPATVGTSPVGAGPASSN